MRRLVIPEAPQRPNPLIQLSQIRSLNPYIQLVCSFLPRPLSKKCRKIFTFQNAHVASLLALLSPPLHALSLFEDLNGGSNHLHVFSLPVFRFIYRIFRSQACMATLSTEEKGYSTRPLLAVEAYRAS